MNNSEIKTFTAQILSNIDGSVLHTETFTATSVADVDAAQARLESFDHPWRIVAVF